MSNDAKQLLVIEHRVKLTKATVAALEENFVVVRGTPSDFHVVGNHPPVTDALVGQVALDTIATYNWNSHNSNQVRWTFAQNLAIALGYGDAVKMK